MLKRRIQSREANNLSNERKEKRTKYSRVLIVWRFLKVILFICCLTLLFYQSAEFLEIYYKYPTFTKIEFTNPEMFQLPAFTFCNINIIKRSKFCAEYPNLCGIPINIKSFCEDFPFTCKNNPSKPVIPNYSVAMNQLKEVYLSGNITTKFMEEWAWSIEKRYSSDKVQPVFVPGTVGHLYPCYSFNLHLDSPDDPNAMHSTYHITGWQNPKIEIFEINLRRSDQYYHSEPPSAYLSIHSPFVPVNPFYHGRRLIPGYHYSVDIKLEEEHLMPYPYETNCTDYTDLWMKNNKKGPRSQEMCKELCLLDLYQRIRCLLWEDEYQLTLLEYPLNISIGCFYSSPEDLKSIRLKKEILQRCREDCKKTCRIMKYTSSIVETALVNSKEDTHEKDSEMDLIQVEISLPQTQVTVQRHFPEYSTGDLFSYIGGLMGCWLGVSVWAFAEMAESVFQKLLRWMEQIKKYYKVTSRTPITAVSNSN